MENILHNGNFCAYVSKNREFLPSHFPTLGRSENIFILHQKMREKCHKKMREMVMKALRMKKRETFYLVHAITT